MKILSPTVVAALIFISSFSFAEEKELRFIPKSGFVPNAETAISIAVAVWTPIYGKSQIESEKPYSAKLRNGIWYVNGHLPEGWKGGVAEAEISQRTGEILRVIHGE